MTEYEIQLAIHYNEGLIKAANIILSTCTIPEQTEREINTLISDWNGNLEYYKELLNFQATAK